MTRIVGNAVHQFACGSLGDAGDGKALNLFKKHAAQAKNNLVTRQNEQPVSDRGASAVKQLNEYDLRDDKKIHRKLYGLFAEDVIVRHNLRETGCDEFQKRNRNEKHHGADDKPLIGARYLPKTLGDLLAVKAGKAGLRALAVSSAALGADSFRGSIFMECVLIVVQKAICRFYRCGDLAFFTAIRTGNQHRFSTLRRIFCENAANAHGEFEIRHVRKHFLDDLRIIFKNEEVFTGYKNETVRFLIGDLTVEIVFPHGDDIFLTQVRKIFRRTGIQTFFTICQCSHPALQEKLDLLAALAVKFIRIFDHEAVTIHVEDEKSALAGANDAAESILQGERHSAARSFNVPVREAEAILDGVDLLDNGGIIFALKLTDEHLLFVACEIIHGADGRKLHVVHIQYGDIFPKEFIREISVERHALGLCLLGCAHIKKTVFCGKRSVFIGDRNRIGVFDRASFGTAVSAFTGTSAPSSARTSAGTAKIHHSIVLSALSFIRKSSPKETGRASFALLCKFDC